MNDVTFINYTLGETYSKMIELDTDSNTTVSRAYYNEYQGNKSPDKSAGKSVIYSYPKGQMPDTEKIGSKSTPTPGSVTSVQVPGRE